MKKLLLLALVVFAAAACEPKGDELYMYSQVFTVESEHWKFVENDNDSYYYYTFGMPRLTGKVCDIGQVSATRYVGDDVQSPLGETRHFEYLDGEWLDWTETIRFQYAPGEITFIVSYSDSRFLDYRPGDMSFRVVLSY